VLKLYVFCARLAGVVWQGVIFLPEVEGSLKREKLWMSDKEVLSEEEREELMSLGARIIADIEQLLEGRSSAIRTRFTHGVTLEIGGTGARLTRSAEMLLFFVITDLGGSDERQIEEFIDERLLEIFKDPSMIRYKAQHSFEVVPE
jgi:hypothetical protein